MRVSVNKLKKEKTKKSRSNHQKVQFVSLVKREDVVAAKWPIVQLAKNKVKHKKPHNISWIMSPPGGGGGHQNIFRFIDYLDKSGFSNTVYLYSTNDDTTVGQARENVKNYSKAKNVKISKYKGNIAESDILFATDGKQPTQY